MTATPNDHHTRHSMHCAALNKQHCKLQTAFMILSESNVMRLISHVNIYDVDKHLLKVVLQKFIC